MENDARAAALADNLLHMVPTELKGAGATKMYLDYGCANGTITRHVATSLGVLEENTIGADIVDTGDHRGYTFMRISPDSASPLHLIADKSVDLITISMVLHHVADLPVVLREFARILSPTGAIIVREHDCTTPEFAAFLDVLHGLYSLVWTEPPEDPTFLETYSAHYRAETEWTTAFAEHGFTRTARKYTISKRVAGQYINVTRAFYAVFQRNIKP
jgi:SAM-dependent methyltransferase